ncbi:MULTISPECIES: Fur family transcriptional regulator [unclassified Amycolatopsis]|uniref:Fur family transcriptional regulator n=1 Tax=unclassified Amycolatopsis TaxID=2618356 RepID=UPI001C6A63C0|nr:Fur family transcriptional regulator [Amycolatopsis sp. DSM 110486]QYN22123.1 transcriptional repressor [Amycolatopsis sp. DSM 110486]
MPATDPADRLRGVSLRVTKQRTAVLHAVAQRPHTDVEAVVRAVRSELGAVSTQAVYDILAALGEVGLVRRIEPAGSPARFEVRTGDNHHHVVCRRCGAVADIDCAVGERPCLAPASTNGFVIDEAEVTYWGLCPSCNEN